MAVETPGSQSALRESNQRRVIYAVRSAGSLTQAEIARTTGLSAATVSNIVRELRSAGTLTVTPTSSGGRRAQSVSLARATGLIVGVEIGADRLWSVLCNHDHEVLAEESIPYDAASSVERGLRRTEWLVSTLLRQARVDRSAVRGVGVGVPGPIDAVSGQVAAPALLPAWHGAGIGTELSDRLDLPVYVDNDANAAALGELLWGAGRGISDMVYLKLATGVGAALVLRGDVYPGAAGFAGEIGHITVDEQGRICRCGNRGCLETLVGGPYLVDLLPGRRPEGPATPAGAHTRGTPSLRTLVDAAIAGDLGCRRIVADAGRAVGAATAILCNVLNPSRVVVGGQLAETEDLLLNPIRETLQRQALPNAAAGVEVVPAQLGERAIALGAVAHVERALARAADLGSL
jgi:predicted NBD/HSP70 family sugar kinase/DNA-binding XRE family transcriptional regulator